MSNYTREQLDRRVKGLLNVYPSAIGKKIVARNVHGDEIDIDGELTEEQFKSIQLYYTLIILDDIPPSE